MKENKNSCKKGEILVEDLGADLKGHDNAAGLLGYLDFCPSCWYCHKLQEMTRSSVETRTILGQCARTCH